MQNLHYKTFLTGLLVLGFFTTDFLFAQTDSTTVKPSFSISGYVDTYYFTNLNMPSSRDNMGQSGVGRGFDRRVDQFQLGMVQTILKYTTSKTEVVADLVFGPSGVYGNYGNVPTSLGSTPSYYGTPLANDAISALLIKQAYIKYNATKRLSFTLGQFSTHIGYEYIESPLNFFYSINHTFNSGIPFYHQGLKAQYALSDKLSVMVGITNGFDHIHDNNRSKAFTAQVAFIPFEGMSSYFNYFISNEENADSLGNTPQGYFSVYDFNGTYTVNDKFSVGYWFMLGSQKGLQGGMGTFAPTSGDMNKVETWGGGNLYFMYKYSDMFSLGLRTEYFDNTSGARGIRNYDRSSGVVRAVGTDCYTLTLTGNIYLDGGNLILRPELRYDQFGKLDGAANTESQQFMDSAGKFTKNTQTTIGLAAIYKF